MSVSFHYISFRHYDITSITPLHFSSSLSLRHYFLRFDFDSDYALSFSLILIDAIFAFAFILFSLAC
jgi:hypothetical protein